MPVRTIPDIIKREILFSGGTDEASAANKISDEDCLEMENFRLSRDGKRTVKRLGLHKEAQIEDDGYGQYTPKDVFGYTTYYDSNDNFCQIIVAEGAIWRKVGAGDWSSIHSFASVISHPVRIHDIHDKQIIITEGDNRFINAAGNDYKMGIDAPATLPTPFTSFANTPPLDDDMDYADQAGMDDVWTDEDSGGSATSTLSSTDPNSTEGPDGDSKYMYFANASPSTGEYARRTLTLTAIGTKFNVEFDIYIDDLGYIPWANYFYIHIYNGVTRLRINYDIENFNIYDGSSWHTFKNWGSAGQTTLDKWMNWKITVDSSHPSATVVEVFLDDVSLGSMTINDQSEVTPGKVIVAVQSIYDTGSHNTHVYLDNFKIGGTEGGELRGIHRYAVTFMRSGNYGAESNPIKSLIGDATYVPIGDETGDATTCTTGGTYTGATSKTFRVRIDGTDPADTYEWSENDGESWNSTDVPIADGVAMLLSYGVTVTLIGTTGHVSGGLWYFDCDVCSVAASDRQANLSSIPRDANSANTGTDRRRLWRTVSGGARFYWLATIHDNTTTTFVDNIPDSMLGSEVKEDHDVLPNGKFSCWWDNKLWVSGKKLDADGVAMDAEENLVYHSQTDEPEHFDTANRYIIIRKGDAYDEISGMIPYKDNLYVFKRNSIYIIQKKSYGLYGRYLINTDIGCIAPWSLIEVNNLLMFLSYRGWELYNGFEPYSTTFGVPFVRTLDSIDTSDVSNFSNGAPTTSGYNKIVSTHLRKRNEVWMSVPYRTGSLDPCTCVYNYARNKFYIFTFHKTPTYLGDARDSDNAMQNYMGTGDGYLFLCDSTYRDDTTNITAKIRKGWIESIRYADWRRVEVEFEIPNGKILTMNCFVNFDKDVARTDTMTGVSLNATDIELRRVIRDFSELGLRGKYFAIQFTNAENLGGDLKLNRAYIYYHPRAIKGRIEGD